jgi:DNA-binding response OmpR family regulator
LHRRTILLAEDNPALSLLYQNELGAPGFRVLTCDNCEAIAAELLHEKVDLLIADLNMAETNVLQHIRGVREKSPKLPIIILSEDHKDLSRDFLDRGYNIQAFIQKPVNFWVMKRIITEMFQGSGKVPA